jgi:Uma2 family endonuclease
MTLIATNSLTSEIPNWPVKRFTVEEYQRLAEIGFLHEDDNLELLNGWLVPKMTKNPLHDSTIDMLEGLLLDVLPRGWYVRVQNVLVTNDSCPEPDLVVVHGARSTFRRRHPQGVDAALVIEVADSSVQFDRDKAAIYARAGVVEYWIVNLIDWQVERHTGPQIDGTYRHRDVLTSEGMIPVMIGGKSIGEISLAGVLSPLE